MYRVIIKRKELKKVERMPLNAQRTFRKLLIDLRDTGAIQKGYHNFSALGDNKYHCHLAYGWVACWRWEKGTIEIEVYYAGRRENAPY